jgi:hypothetical protein
MHASIPCRRTGTHQRGIALFGRMHVSVRSMVSRRPKAVFDHKKLIAMKQPFAAHGKIGLREFL